MCGIVASYDFGWVAQTALSLRERGTKQWSVSAINADTCTIEQLHKSAMDYTAVEALRMITQSPNLYYIIHVQSPTGSKFNWHPATLEHHALWHNGMIDSNYSEKLQVRDKWDTQVLLDSIALPRSRVDFSLLNDFQGSFACYYLRKDHGLFAFRNAISPQFQRGTDFCSIPFEDAQKIPANTIVDMLTGHYKGSFNNEYNPFGV
jgi:hypothetical protein